jgi:short-subunit dehydrogenase
MRAWELDATDAGALLVNLHGPIATIATVRPAPLAQGRGGIGLVASVAGYRGLRKAFIYGASKAALIDFTETLYFDLHPRGLGVYLIIARLRADAIDRQECVRDAPSHFCGRGRASDAARLAGRGIRDRRSARVHAAVEDPAPAALPDCTSLS